MQENNQEKQQDKEKNSEQTAKEIASVENVEDRKEAEKDKEEKPSALDQPKARKKRRYLYVVAALLSFVCVVLGGLQMGVLYTATHWSYWYPDYEMIDILPILEKETLDESDYEVLYAQTGLTNLAVDDMRDKPEEILRIQAFYFREQNVKAIRFNPFTYIEEIDEELPIATLREGDIIVSATTRVSWWRYGHAALVADPVKKLVIESVGPGTDSEYNSFHEFTNLANLLILRPMVDEETKKAVVQNAKENLLGIKYRFTVGVFSKKYVEDIKATQCAHFVWYAYKKFGVDLDSNGGGIVKPQDIALSNKVEVVQVYGFNPKTLWA